MRNLIRFLTLVIVVGSTAFSIYAFASSQPGLGTSGEGAASISGWAVSNIQYDVSDHAALVQSVSFDLDSPAKHVSVKLNSSEQVFSVCANLGAYHWQCDFQTGVQLTDMDEFRLIAVGN